MQPRLRPTPRWVWAALLVGAVVMVAWAWFLLGFVHEPSAKGRVGAVLWTWTIGSAASAIVGGLSAIGLVRRQPWGRLLAWIASIAMTVTVVGALAGIPVLIALVASRNSSSARRAPGAHLGK